MPLDPEIGFTSSEIRDPNRFVGRTELISDCIKALNAPLSLIAIYGKRGVGKSSLLRQIQQMALGDYGLAEKAGIATSIPERPRRYLTVYYTCDSMINTSRDLVARLCADQDTDDGLLRLVPNDGKEIVEFTRAKEVSGGADLKVASWGTKGIESSKYAKVVPNDPVQTFRNFVNAVVTHQVKARMHRDGLLILLDEFDVVKDKGDLGSLIKSMSSETVKFAVCGVARDLQELVADHASVERLLEEGALQVKPMNQGEASEIIHTAERLFQGALTFDPLIIDKIVEHSSGYPYLIQIIGKACVHKANAQGATIVDQKIYDLVLEDIKHGRAFPTLESAYLRAIGNSPERQLLLHLFAEQPEDNALFNDDVGRVVLRNVRSVAGEFNIDYVDQLIPRLVDKTYGPALIKSGEKQGVYEFVNPVFRLYVRLRKI